MAGLLFGIGFMCMCIASFLFGYSIGDNFDE